MLFSADDILKNAEDIDGIKVIKLNGKDGVNIGDTIKLNGDGSFSSKSADEQKDGELEKEGDDVEEIKENDVEEIENTGNHGHNIL